MTGVMAEDDLLLESFRSGPSTVAIPAADLRSRLTDGAEVSYEATEEIDGVFGIRPMASRRYDASHSRRPSPTLWWLNEASRMGRRRNEVFRAFRAEPPSQRCKGWTWTEQTPRR
jgi:hypothetical protein